MKYNIAGELTVAVVLLGLLFVLFNPWQAAMPNYLVMSLMVGILVLFVIFATFLWKEGRGDERERLHQMFADRIAYLFGSLVLVGGIILEEFLHILDPWLIAALSIMIAAKVIGSIYTKIKL